MPDGQYQHMYYLPFICFSSIFFLLIYSLQCLGKHCIISFSKIYTLIYCLLSKRFEQVYEDTHNIWHSQQYIFTREYYTRSPFFPPISLIYDLHYLCRLIYFKIKRICFEKSADKRAKVFSKLKSVVFII